MVRNVCFYTKSVVPIIEFCLLIFNRCYKYSLTNCGFSDIGYHFSIDFNHLSQKMVEICSKLTIKTPERRQ